jgi:hypothetical protein
VKPIVFRTLGEPEGRPTTSINSLQGLQAGLLTKKLHHVLQTIAIDVIGIFVDAIINICRSIVVALGHPHAARNQVEVRRLIIDTEGRTVLRPPRLVCAASASILRDINSLDVRNERRGHADVVREACIALSATGGFIAAAI